MANADEYRDWAAQAIDRRTRDALYSEADRIDQREASRSGAVEIRITVGGVA